VTPHDHEQLEWLEIDGLGGFACSTVSGVRTRRYHDLVGVGLGHVSELADAEPPFTPRGCPFQAWSVGELLRLDRLVLRDTQPSAEGEHQCEASPSLSCLPV
jgi:hypothetical protein